MANAILFFMYNQTPEQLALTQESYASILAQDIPGGIDLYIVNNGSTEPTVEWLNSLADSCPEHVNIVCFNYSENVSPVLLYNKYYDLIFADHPCILSIPNDVIAPPNLFSEMVQFPAGLVSAAVTEDRDFPRNMKATGVHDRASLAVCLLRKWVYDALVSRFGSFVEDSTEGELGVESIKYLYSGGKMDVVAYNLCKEGEAFILPKKGVFRIGAADIGFKLPGGDNGFLHVPDRMGYEFRLFSSQAFFTPFVAKLVKITYIVNS